MDKKWRSAKPNSSRPYQKSKRLGDRDFRPYKPADDSTFASDLAEYVLTSLIGDAGNIQIKKESLESHHVRISATCDPALTGKLIGKGGRTISALRLLVRTIAAEHGQKIDIELLSTEPQDTADSSSTSNEFLN